MGLFAVVATCVVASSGASGTASADVSATPPVTSGLQLWFEADTEAEADGAPVASWADKSGLGRDLTSQYGSGPTMRRNAVNGRAAVEFAGDTGSLLKTYGSTFTIAQPDTFFIVYRSTDTDTSAGAFVLDSTNSSVRQTFGRPGLHQVGIYANNDLTANGLTYPFGFQLWSGTFSGTGSSLYQNGSQVGSGNAGGSSLSGLTVGGLSTSGPYGYDFARAQIAEILVYSGSMTAAQRQSMNDWLNQKYAVMAPPSAPANTVLPTLAGTARDGGVLSTTNGTWTGSTPQTYTYQWQRCASGGGSCSGISGATGASYSVVTADVGSTLRVVVTATNSVGSASATSAASALIGAATPLNSALPTISGSAAQGQALAASAGTWTGTAPISYAYEWRRCDGGGANCTAVGTGPSYTLAAADVGSTIRLAVTASNAAGSATALSAATAAVTPPVTATDPPPVTAGLQLWFDANQEAYGDGAAVTKWTDHSGFARDLTAFDAGAAATFRRTAVNGRAAVEFNGASSLLKTYGSTFTIAQPDTFFIVYRQLDTSTANIFDSMNAAARQSFGRISTANVDMYGDVDLTAADTIPFPGYELWSGAFNGNASSLSRNGVQVASGRAGSAPMTGFTLGALSTSGQYGYQYSHSLVAEILWYSGALTTAQQQQIATWLNGKYAYLTAPAIPVNTALPAITGAAIGGSTLTASSGSWTGAAPLTFTYQWQRCNSAGGSCAPIPGATGTSFLLTAADVGSSLRVVVTATNAAGNGSATSAFSAAVTAAQPLNVVPPAVSGFASQGQTLTGSTGTWTGTAPISYAYQWQRCDSAGAACAAISGATNTGYVVDPADVGSRLRVAVTATNSAGNTTVSSAATAAVGVAPPVNTAPPTITGSALQGQTLSASTGAWTAGGSISYAYEWRRCDLFGANCAAIGSATAASYTPIVGDIGWTIRVAVTATSNGASATAVAQQTATVGSTAEQPPVTAGLQMWFDANQEPYSNGAAVTRWSDHSGFGRDLSAFDSGAAPTYRANAVNGRPAMEFDGISSLMKTYGSTFTINQPDMFFIVYKQLDTGPAAVFDSMSSGNRQTFGRNATYMDMYANLDVISSARSMPFANYDLWSGTFNGTHSGLSSNGAWRSDMNNAGTAPLTGFTLGGLSSAAQYGYNFSHSLVAEILWYSGTLTTDQQNAISAWLETKYAYMYPPGSPVNTVPPTLNGTFQVGATTFPGYQDAGTLTPTTGTWTGNAPISYSYEWYRCDAAGANCNKFIANSSYRLTSSDIGYRFYVRVAAANAISTPIVNTALTPVIGPAAPVNTLLPSNSVSSNTPGGQIWPQAGRWSGTAPITLTHRILRCDGTGANCVPVGTELYTFVASDVGSKFRIEETATNAAGSGVAVGVNGAAVHT